MSARFAVSLGLLALVACGGKTSDVVTDAGGPDDGVDAKPHPTPAPDCPTAQPQDGSSCTKEGIACEYGDDPRYTCNWVASCTQGRWSVSTTNSAWCPTPQPNPASCPATHDLAVQGGDCTDIGVPCEYPEGWCSCIDVGGPPMPDGGGPQAMWMCQSSAQFTQGCPSTRPRLGTACAQADVQCSYSPCGSPDGLSVQCDSTTMTWAPGFGDLCGGAN